ncbi:hypothetical protein PoB_004166700 [Plakobranchus ocellatus]|uniref:Uncharacterized protein n=1 Tax=Plakobranchus ocellatus TaxID=259542 RepID=A0AAV4B7M2_9GAST|nr:hypothetical protein PoB_004166700 [Plakobranchus ocellatus]
MISRSTVYTKRRTPYSVDKVFAKSINYRRNLQSDLDSDEDDDGDNDDDEDGDDDDDDDGGGDYDEDDNDDCGYMDSKYFSPRNTAENVGGAEREGRDDRVEMKSRSWRRSPERRRRIKEGRKSCLQEEEEEEEQMKCTQGLTLVVTRDFWLDFYYFKIQTSRSRNVGSARRQG